MSTKIIKLLCSLILVLAALIYILDTIALITALCVIPMFPNGNPNRIILVVCLIVGGFIFFGAVSRLGDKYLDFISHKENAATTNENNGSNLKEENEEPNRKTDNNPAYVEYENDIA